jgi:hypothetical protein
MEQNNVIIIPDEHCRGLYKQVLNVKDTPIIFLGDYMDPYNFDGTCDEQGIANLEEIFDFAKSNPNVTLLVGNHDSSYIWSFMGFERTSYKFYSELHRLYRDNINLFKPCLRVNNVLFTHAGVCNTWVEVQNNRFEEDDSSFRITQDNIVDYIDNEFTLALKDEFAKGNLRYAYLESPIFDIGWSRGDGAPAGGPFWSDFYDDYKDPENWTIKQIFGHTLSVRMKDNYFLPDVGLIRQKGNGYCIDSRAIFEYNFDTNELKLWQKSEE